jgi:hypothetical protein
MDEVIKDPRRTDRIVAVGKTQENISEAALEAVIFSVSYLILKETSVKSTISLRRNRRGGA